MTPPCRIGPIREFDDVVVEPDATLARYSTFQLGGPCSCLITCATPDALVAVVRELWRQSVTFVLLGGGSNVLISDDGVNGVVVRFVTDSVDCRRAGDRITVSASTSLDAVAGQCAVEGLDGLACCTGIPGTVGGAIVGNAGAWGEQIGDVLASATLLSRDGFIQEVMPESLDFRYRWSRLKESDEIVLSASFDLRPTDSEALMSRRREVLRMRSEKHPDLAVDPCIGSIFKNIDPTSLAGRRQAAGWFLEQAGVKGMQVGGAEIFGKHANIIVKRPNGTASDVHTLMGHMRQRVQEVFDFSLQREVRLLGAFRGESGPALRFH